MSKPSRRVTREARKAPTREARKARREAARQLRAEGCAKPSSPTLSNAKSQFATPQEEGQARQEAVTEHFKILRAQLPALLLKLSNIPDPRCPNKTRHKLTMVLIYGLLSFVFQMASRREANRKMTMPMFRENLKLLVPELEEIPHHDTLYRLLKHIEVEQIAAAHLDVVESLIRKKMFRRYLINGYYPIAIDGTQKLARDWCFSAEALRRRVGSQESGKEQSYIYVLEACLAFANGMVIPLASEFLARSQGDPEGSKQDCEQRAFQRLAEKLKQRFPRLKILVLLDGLYPNGPVVQRCKRYHWQFMIVLQDRSLPSVWAEFNGLLPLQPQNRWQREWGGRQQQFAWVNEIEYAYGSNQRRRIRIHLVVCKETWREVDSSGEIVEHRSRHAWISSQSLDPQNLHERCNLAARHRWGIEANILVEKHQGYRYEHCFAHNFNAMKGYHYLMRLAHLINVLARFSQGLAKAIRTLGVRGLTEWVRETVAGPWLDPETLRAQFFRRYQIRLV